MEAVEYECKFISIVNSIEEFEDLQKCINTSIISNEEVFVWSEDDVKFKTILMLILSNMKLKSSNLPFLNSFTNIIHLNLSFNKLTTVTFLSELKILETLDLSHNKITTINNISEAFKLKILRLNSNSISNVESISSITSLQELWLNSNSIDWTQIIHLQNLKNLSTITLFSNPCQKKNNYLDFLYAINPSIVCVDGKKVVPGDRDSDFLKSTDGRMMLNQIRLLTSATIRPNIPLEDDDNNIDRNISDTMSTQSEGAKRTSTRKVENTITTRHTSIPVFRANRKDLVKTKKLTTKNVVKNSNKLPRKYITSNKADTTNGGNEDDNENTIDNQSNNHIEIVESKSEISIIADKEEEEPIIIRFTNSIESTVSFCLHSDGSGYVRWSRGGPIACSISGNRMLASYKTSSVAVVMDCNHDSNNLITNGSTSSNNGMGGGGGGTVMDLRGKCLLSLTSSGEAFVLDPVGNNIATYTRPNKSQTIIIQNNHILLPTNDTITNTTNTDIDSSENVTEVLTTEEREKVALEVVAGSTSSSNIPSDDITHEWYIGGMHITFQPSTWEIAVKLANGRVECVFSSIYGGKLIRELEVESDPRNKMRKVVTDGKSVDVTGPVRQRTHRAVEAVSRSKATDGNTVNATSTTTTTQIDINNSNTKYNINSINKNSIVDNNSNNSNNNYINETAVSHSVTGGGKGGSINSNTNTSTAMNHDALRSGLQSVVSQLDDLMAGFGKKRVS